MLHSAASRNTGEIVHTATLYQIGYMAVVLMIALTTIVTTGWLHNVFFFGLAIVLAAGSVGAARGAVQAQVQVYESQHVWRKMVELEDKIKRLERGERS